MWVEPLVKLRRARVRVDCLVDVFRAPLRPRTCSPFTPPGFCSATSSTVGCWMLGTGPPRCARRTGAARGLAGQHSGMQAHSAARGLRTKCRVHTLAQVPRTTILP